MWILTNIIKTRKLLKGGLYLKVRTRRFVYFWQMMTSFHQENIRLLTDDSSD